MAVKLGDVRTEMSGEVLDAHEDIMAAITQHPPVLATGVLSSIIPYLFRHMNAEVRLRGFDEFAAFCRGRIKTEMEN